MVSLVSRFSPVVAILVLASCGYDSRPFSTQELEGVPTMEVDCLVGPCSITVKGEDGLYRGYLEQGTDLRPLKDYKFDDYIELEVREGDTIDLTVRSGEKKGTPMAKLWAYEGFFLICVTPELSFTHEGGVISVAGEVLTSSYTVKRRPENPFEY